MAGNYFGFSVLSSTGSAGVPVGPETPTGLINSANLIYTLANTPRSGTLVVFKNGVMDTGWSIVGNTLTMSVAPDTGDSLVVFYRY